MEDIVRACNSTVRFSKFTLNIKVHKKFEGRNFVQLLGELIFYRNNKTIK